jgi:hypothetical protein
MTLSRYPIKQSVVVNTKTGRAFRGVLWSKRGPVLLLKNVTLIEAGMTTPVDGDVVVERSNVDFVQVPPQ